MKAVPGLSRLLDRATVNRILDAHASVTDGNVSLGLIDDRGRLFAGQTTLRGTELASLLNAFRGKDPHVAVGTSLGLMIFLAISGALRHHLSYHTVEWGMALGLAVGGVIGAFFVGAPLSNALKSFTLTKLFGGLLIIMGLKMLGVWGYLARLVLDKR